MDWMLGRKETERLLYLARRRYRIMADVAEDLLQSARVTFLQVRERYPRPEEHPRILVGIFRNKCREHVGQAVKASRQMESLRSMAAAGELGTPTTPADAGKAAGVLGDLVREEEGRQIFAALAELRPRARELLRLIAEEGVTRADLIARYELNPNTLDSRLHTYRKELKGLLERRGVKP
jgi:RNA polymerase sigma factor (sigma-70 family)